VVNVVATTGVGTTFSLMINDWAGGNLLLALGLIALASLVLGTGLPVTASYIVLATLSAPALYQLIAGSQLVDLLASGALPQAARDVLVAAQPSLAKALSAAMPAAEAEALLQGLPSHVTGLVIERALDPGLLAVALLSAHMVIFWLSQDSNVTPPVCIVAFAAAAIAKTRPLATGFTSWKVAKGLYLIPVLFAYTPILSGDWAAPLQVFVFAGIALYALAGALDGYLEGPLGPLERGAAAAIGIALIWPDTLVLNLLAVPVLIGLALYSRRGAQLTAGSTVK
ncbi:MAG: TRAP transporter large permease subunit, partial [Alphaproteobacteria bacterium]|nr:TRAP transporter large permease subunit [Alphaproteobacteria bacterium]